MRKLILDRIKEIHLQEQGFIKSLMKWQNFTLNNVPIWEVDFNTLTDENLINTFERIIIRLARQY